MSGNQTERQKEQARVDQVIRQISERIASLERHVQDVKSDVTGIRKHFWEDVTINLSNAAEAAETAASIKQQAEVLSERERSLRHGRNQLAVLNKLKESPYFGRIDFREDGETKAEPIYLGITSFFDEKSERFLVYDWRAPISSLYYDYPPGPAQYEAPGGKVSGTVELKRQFVIRDGKIRSMFDTNLTIGDDLLKEVLGQKSDAQMKTIVATIQKEQNRIIRDEKSQLLIVKGPAGSGKTSAALQRIAYLLYRYRNTLRADQIVLFSPNPMFSGYISTVLPELGEENMEQATFQEYVEYRIGNTFRLEDPFAQMESILSPGDDAETALRIAAIRYKGSLAFLELMDQYASYLGREDLIFKNVKFRGETILSADFIKERFYALDPSLPIPVRMQRIADELLALLKERERLEQDKAWVEEEMELLDKEDYMLADQALRKKSLHLKEPLDDVQRQREYLAAMIVQKRFKPLRLRIKRLGFLNLPAVYRQLFADPEFALRFAPENALPEQWEKICAHTAEKLEQNVLAWEDATPYLYLREKLLGFQTNNAVRHVFIDEAQDYSPFQFAFIKRLFPRSKMTVLGDWNQAIYAHACDSDPASLAVLYEHQPPETVEWRKSYRSTRQIVEFTRHLIPGGESIEPFNREGRKPTLTRAADENELAGNISKRIGELQAAGYKTIAVICKTARESEKAYGELHRHIPLRLIAKETTSFAPGVVVIPSYLAKGVEFDAVIVYNASKEQYGKERERKLFYTVCTRAMHELHLFYTGDPSPFLSSLPADTYAVTDGRP